jgi:tol-pal system protein YbgF
MRRFAFCLISIILFSGYTSAYAGLFSDDEARQAILEIRQQVQNQVQIQQDQQTKNDDATKQTQNSLLDLQNQISQLHSNMQLLEGKIEELTHNFSQYQSTKQLEIVHLNDRLKALEPTAVNVDGVQFQTAPSEKSSFDAALFSFQEGNFKIAAAQFKKIIQMHGKSSGYYAPSLFWQGNALYALAKFKEAITSLQTFLSAAPKDSNAPDADLVIANCQLELKDISLGRETLRTLLKKYPGSNAANTAKQRLKQLE